VAALRAGASLLQVGVRAVDGRFARGDVVAVVGPGGEAIARGLAAYSAEEAARIAGLKGDALAAALGYAPRAAMIHRDHMVLL
jgi:glutamate 5-kinase